MKHASLFSGIGGFDLAAEWMGWENVLHCEKNPFCREILKYYWPNAISYEDITTTDFSIHRGKIDILTGGFPCQTFSVAGKGECDLSLWKEMLRAVREIQPGDLVAENVPGLLSQQRGLAFQTVCSDLENEGYEIQPLIIPAASKGAPHLRERIWIVAHSNNRYERNHTGEHEEDGKEAGLQKRNCLQKSIQPNSRWINGNSTIQGLPKSQTGKKQQSLPEIERTNSQINTDTKSIGLQRSKQTNGSEGKKCNDQFSYGCNREWEQSAVEVATRLCRMDARVPNRVERIKALGNSIVPQVAYEIFKTIAILKDTE